MTSHGAANWVRHVCINGWPVMTETKLTTTHNEQIVYVYGQQDVMGTVKFHCSGIHCSGNRVNRVCDFKWVACAGIRRLSCGIQGVNAEDASRVCVCGCVPQVRALDATCRESDSAKGWNPLYSLAGRHVSQYGKHVGDDAGSKHDKHGTSDKDEGERA